MNQEQFYERCAQLLNTEHIFIQPPPSNRLRYDGTIRNTYKTRYNGRYPGNGRFPGRGLIRHFGASIQINLHNPPLNMVCRSQEEALAAIGKVVDGLESD